MIVPVMAISNLVLTQQIYSEETNGAHEHYREPVPLILLSSPKQTNKQTERTLAGTPQQLWPITAGLFLVPCPPSPVPRSTFDYSNIR